MTTDLEWYEDYQDLEHKLLEQDQEELMTEKKESLFPVEETKFTEAEAPASWNTKYTHPLGFQCQLTLRGKHGSELLNRVDSALDWLIENGCYPYPLNKPRPSNTDISFGDGGTGNSWCTIHDVEMQRYEKDGRHWYSHKYGDYWCKGAKQNV